MKKASEMPHLKPVDTGVTVNKPTIPDSSWSLEQLKVFARTEHDALLGYAKKTALHTFRLGQALSLAKSKAKHGEWGDFLSDVGISVATDHRARKLFEFFKSIEEVEGLAISEAYEQSGISIGKARIPSDEESSDQDIIVVDVSSDPSNEQSEDDLKDVFEDESDSDPEDDSDNDSNDSDVDENENTAKQSSNRKTEKSDSESSQTPPPVEDSFSLRLAEVCTRLEWLATAANNVTAVGDELAHLFELIERAQSQLEKLQDVLSHD